MSRSAKKRNNDRNSKLDIRLSSANQTQNVKQPSASSDSAHAYDHMHIPEEGSVIPDNSDLRIPDGGISEADKALQELAFDSVRSYYTFINLAALVIIILGIALTLLFIRETEMYGEDNIQLTSQTFLDGSFTNSLSNRYTNESKLGAVIDKLSSIAQYAYGFTADAPRVSINTDPMTPDSGYLPDAPTTSAMMTTAKTTPSQPGEIYVDPSVTGTPVTMPSVTLTVENSFTGAVAHTTTTNDTTTLTTTKPYSPTATSTETVQSSDQQSTTTPAETSATVSSSETTTTTTTETTTEPTVTTTPESQPTETASPTETEPQMTDAPPDSDPEAASNQ